MATIPVNRDDNSYVRNSTPTFADILAQLSQDERFRATVYAMNTLLVQKGIYSPDEFEHYVRQWAKTHCSS